jgi:hypothetical protein
MANGTAPAARLPPGDVARQLDGYFATLENSWKQAVDRGGNTVVTLDLAGRSVRLGLTSGVPAAILPALAHVTRPTDLQPDFEVLVWDEASTATPLPPPPWSWPPPGSAVRLSLPAGGEGYRIPVSRTPGSFAMLSLAARRAIVWIENAATLAWHHRAAPLLQAWQWWSMAGGARILHAGCVGTPAAAVILVGRGGSGKSSTAVLGALAGLDYVGDDYCLLETGPEPIAHSLYSTAKIHPGHLARFPDIPATSVLQPSEPGEKAVLFMERAAPDRMAVQLPIRSVVAPQVTGTDRPRLERLTSAEAMMAIAPSTLLQLYRHADTGCGDLAELVRRLPCWRLELGGRMADVPDLVRRHLEAV